MSIILYSCPFVPAEWIVAHGLRPSRILPRSVGAVHRAGAGVCPYAEAFMVAAAHEPAAGIVVTTTCDQMRRGAEWIADASRRPVFLMHVPKTWETVNAQKLYLAEVERLGRFLVAIGGTSPSRETLADVMREYDGARAALRAARGHLPPRRFSEAIAAFHQSGLPETDKAVALPNGRIGSHPSVGVPLALVGGPMLAEHFEIFDLIEAAGGQVVLDATTTGEMTLPAPFNRRELSEDPFMTLAGAYFGSIPEAFRRSNSALYLWLKRELAARGVRGIIFRRYLWCDTWHAELQRMREWSGLPILDVEIGDEPRVNGYDTSRIQSFLEMLR